MEPPEQRRQKIDTRHHQLLADEERRHTLCILSETDGPISLSTLATKVASRSLRQPAESIRRDEREDREIALYHNHLPRMEDHGIVEFDTVERTVVLRETATTSDLLDALPGAEPL